MPSAGQAGQHLAYDSTHGLTPPPDWISTRRPGLNHLVTTILPEPEQQQEYRSGPACQCRRGSRPCAVQPTLRGSGRFSARIMAAHCRVIESCPSPPQTHSAHADMARAAQRPQPGSVSERERGGKLPCLPACVRQRSDRHPHGRDAGRAGRGHLRRHVDRVGHGSIPHRHRHATSPPACRPWPTCSRSRR